MTVTVIATVLARPERRDELYRLLVKLVAPTRAEPGCLNYDLLVDAEDPCVFVFHDNWRSEADLRAHMGMAHMEPLVSQLERLAARPIDVRRLTMVAVKA